MNRPTLSRKLKSENKKYHSSIAVVLFVVFITVTVSILFLAFKNIFDSKNKESTVQESDSDKSIEETKIEEKTVEEETLYTVKAGDSLYTIGLDLGVDWQEIAKENNLEAPYSLSTGQELKIPSQNANNLDNINIEEDL